MRELLPDPLLRRAATVGALVGVGLAAFFLIAHAILIKEIWISGLKGVPVAAVAGAVGAGAIHRVRTRTSATTRRLGASFGSSLAILVLGLGLAGHLRATGADGALWIGAVVGALAAFAGAVTLFLPRAWIEASATAVVANAMPAVFLLFPAELTGLDRIPNPLPIAAVLAALEIGAAHVAAWAGAGKRG